MPEIEVSDVSCAAAIPVSDGYLYRCARRLPHTTRHFGLPHTRLGKFCGKRIGQDHICTRPITHPTEEPHMFYRYTPDAQGAQ